MSLHQLFLALLLSTSWLSSAQKNRTADFFVKAEIPKWNLSYASLVIEGETVHSDSILDGTFQYRGKVKGTKEGKFLIQKKSWLVTLPIYIEAGVICIKESRDFYISGTINNDLFHAFQKKADSIRGNFYTDEGIARQRAYAKLYIATNLNSLITAEIYRAYILPSAFSEEEKLSLYNSLHPTVKNSFGGKYVKYRLDQLIGTSVGKSAPLFSQKDTAGRSVSLKSFRNQYVLLDFWASWCGPCREENPTVKKVYDKYKDQGFTVVSVSLDKDKQLWLKAITRDGLPWTHLSDLKGWHNAVAQKYYVEAIPANYLIDPKGVIIAKNLVGDSLQTKLASIFKPSSNDRGKNE
jgi:peroxiredoxin